MTTREFARAPCNISNVVIEASRRERANERAAARTNPQPSHRGARASHPRSRPNRRVAATPDSTARARVMSTVRRACRAFARVASGLAATTSGSTSTVSPRVAVPVAARARAFARANASASRGATTPVVDRYGASKGPMAGLLRVLRDDGALTTRELFDRAVEREVPTRSMRHMKGLLAKMKAIDRVKATPPGAVSASGEEGAVQAGRGRRARGNYTFSITETGMKHIEKLDRSVSPPPPASA